jgi:hypothetical protein
MRTDYGGQVANRKLPPTTGRFSHMNGTNIPGTLPVAAWYSTQVAVCDQTTRRRTAIAAAWLLGATPPLLGGVVFVFGCCVLVFSTRWCVRPRANPMDRYLQCHD